MRNVENKKITPRIFDGLYKLLNVEGKRFLPYKTRYS